MHLRHSSVSPLRIKSPKPIHICSCQFILTLDGFDISALFYASHVGKIHSIIYGHLYKEISETTVEEGSEEC